MKNLILIFLILTSAKAFSIDYVAIASGNWSNAATWSPSGTPGSADNVTIGSTFNVTVDANTTCTNVTISTSTATLTTVNKDLTIDGVLANSGTLSITGNGKITLNSTTSTLTNNAGANISVGAGGTLDTKFTITNDGIITVTGTLSLSGSADRSIGGLGTATITNLTTANSGTKTISSGSWTVTSLTTGGGGNVTFDGPSLSATTLTLGGTGNITFKKNTSVFNVGTLIHQGTGSSAKISFNDDNYTLSLTNFTMNTGSSNGCDITKDVVVAGTLTLTLGNIFLGSGAQLTANTIIGGSSTSYVVPSPGATSTGSRLKRDVGTSPTTFPIGTSISYTPVTVTFPSANTFTARVSASFANTLPNPEGGIKLEWTFTNGSAVGGTATLGLTWNAGDIGTSFDGMNAQAYRYSSGWKQKGGTVSGNSISVNTDNFSPWAVFSPAALPVELVSFTAIEQNGNAKLTWQTVSERNNRGFDIEKSLDAKSFYKIGSKDGAGTSEQVRLYSFVDDELSDVSYYRLKQVDMDGGFTYSKIAVVVPEGASDELMVSPNPSNDKLKISIKGTIQQVNILNLNGQLMLSNSSKTIDIANLPDGIYLLQVVTENGVRTKKVVKQ